MGLGSGYMYMYLYSPQLTAIILSLSSLIYIYNIGAIVT